MYAGSSYASTEYAATRTFNFIAPVVKLIARTLQSFSGITFVPMLKFRTTAVKSAMGVASVLILKFRNTTLKEPNTDANTLEF